MFTVLTVHSLIDVAPFGFITNLGEQKKNVETIVKIQNFKNTIIIMLFFLITNSKFLQIFSGRFHIDLVFAFRARLLPLQKLMSYNVVANS
jgi:hypothetical protein